MTFLHIVKFVGLIGGIIAGCAVLVFVLCKLGTKQKRKTELRQAAEKQMREESLERMILNEKHVQTGRDKAYNPYEVSYEKGNGVKLQKTVGQILVSLEEKNELSTKKFVLNPVNTIRIGSGLHGNDVIVQGEKIAEVQCEIFSAGNKIFVRNKNLNHPTVLKRKRERALVDERGLRLQTGDVIMMGKVAYRVTLVGA